MNNFELFSLIFLLLDERWNDCKDKQLGHFLSEMNPFAWTSEDDAVRQLNSQKHKGGN